MHVQSYVFYHIVSQLPGQHKRGSPLLPYWTQTPVHPGHGSQTESARNDPCQIWSKFCHSEFKKWLLAPGEVLPGEAPVVEVGSDVEGGERVQHRGGSLPQEPASLPALLQLQGQVLLQGVTSGIQAPSS